MHKYVWTCTRKLEILGLYTWHWFIILYIVHITQLSWVLHIVNLECSLGIVDIINSK